jgi:hypothetical protein
MASKVTGYRETARAIRKVGQFPRAKVGQASRKALTPMLRATKANLKTNRSYHRGVLSRSMAIRKLKTTSALSQWVIAATGRGIAIAHLVEAGTRPHWQPKRMMMHPGAKAKPFLEPAFFAHDDEAVAIMARELGLGMVRYASTVAYRGK